MAFDKPNKAFEPEIIDEENEDFFGSQDSISIGKIVQMHILRLSSKILDGSSVENADKKTVANDNRREIFIDGLLFLKALIYPYYDKEMISDEATYEKKLKVLEDRFYNACLEKEALKRARMDKVPMKAYEFWKEKLKETDFGYFDKTTAEYDFYIFQKFRLSLELFTAISGLMNRTNYLQEEIYTE